MNHEISMETHWSEEDGCFIAIDPRRPGCSAVGDSLDEAHRELIEARKAWDSARANADAVKYVVSPFGKILPVRRS
jgi:predicted RNase H-like HicB family nuclease